MKRAACLFMVVMLSIAIIFAGQRAGKLAKSGDKSAAKGNYYIAALSYLDALGKKPKSVKTKDKLSEVAQQAYEQKLSLAEQYKSGGNLESALKEFRELESFVNRLRQYISLNFATIDFRATLSNVSEGAAELRYQSAEGFFNARNHQRAIDEYRAALGLKTPYKDCLDKIAESYHRMGTESESGSSFRRAAECYLKACEIRPDYKDSRQKAVAIYYALGEYFLDAGYYRTAYEDFSRAQATNPGYADVGAKLAFAKDLATVRIAFVRFDNITGTNFAGMALADMIMDGIKGRVQSAGSQFISTIDRDELSSLAREQRVAEGQLNENLSSPLKLKGVDYLVFGKLNQVRDVRPGRTVERGTATYEYSVEVPYTNSKGEQKTRTEYRDAPMAFDIVRDGFNLVLGGSVKAIAVKSGAVILNEPVSQEAGDKIVFATNVRMRHPIDSVTLSQDVVTLLEARQQLADVGTVANQMITAIAEAASGALLSALDRPASAPDPAMLKY